MNAEFASLEEKREDLRITAAELLFGRFCRLSLEERFKILVEAIKEFADDEK